MKKGIARELVSMSALALAGVHAQAASAQDAAVPSPSSADSRTAGLEEIIVTAQKRAADVQDVPIAITAVSAQRLQSSGVVSAYDLPNVASGLTAGQSVAGFQPYLRGVGTAFFGPAIENPVSLYIDDVYYSSQLLAPIDLSNINSISVLKGPQGTLFGRNATGGVIQMNTRAPEHHFSAEARTELDNYLTSRNLLYINGGITDNLAANFTAQYTTQGRGWGHNIVTGDGVHKIDDNLALRTRVLWTPGTKTKVNLNLDFSYRKDSLGPNFTLYRKPPIPPIAEPVGGSLYDVGNNPQTDNRLKSGGASLKIEEDLGFASAVSISAYRRYSFNAFYDTDALPLIGSNSKYLPSGNQFSQELQLVSKSNEAFNWVIGGYYFRSRDSINGSYLGFNDASDSLNGDQRVNFSGYDPVFFPFKSYFIYYDDLHLKTESKAAFGETTIRLIDKLRVTLGARYTHERRSIFGTPEVWVAPQVTQDISDAFKLGNLYDNPTTPQTEGLINQSFSTSKATYRAILDYRFDNDVLAYASFNRGFKSGGYNAYYTAPGALPFKGEQLNAYEVGLKSEFFGHRLRLNPSFFYYDYKNLQVLSLIDNAVTTTNARAAEVYGLDMDAVWQPVKALTFNAGLLWMHARYNDFKTAPVYVPGADGRGTVATVGDVSGHQLPFAPDLTFNVSAAYRVDLSARSQLTFNVNYAFNDGYPFEPDNNVRLSSFSLVNASIDWELVNRGLSLGVFVRNLTNKIIPGGVYATPPLGYVADYSNPPRTFGVTASIKFGQ